MSHVGTSALAKPVSRSLVPKQKLKSVAVRPAVSKKSSDIYRKSSDTHEKSSDVCEKSGANCILNVS